MFLEVHQPVGHLQVGNVKDLPRGAERGGIFAVGVDHHDVPFGRSLADAVQDQGPRWSISGTGRTEQGKMLAQHGIDIQPGADVAGGEHLADGDAGTPVAGVDLFEVAGGGRIAHGARHRITRHPTLEPRWIRPVSFSSPPSPRKSIWAMIPPSVRRSLR